MSIDKWTSALTGGPSVYDNDAKHTTATSATESVIGGRNLWLRRQIVDCIHIRKILKRWMKGRDFDHIDIGDIPEEAFDSIWAYCRHCYRCEGCRQFLQYEAVGIENLENGNHTGWLHLQTDKRYRRYWKVDSMEKYWGDRQ